MSRRFRVSAGCAIVLFVAVCLLASGAAGADLRQESPANESGTISPEVASADGTETVLVYFEATPVSADGASATVGQLKNRADTAQEPLHQFAAAQSGVTVLNSFWLGNVAVVRIDHARADVQDLAAIDGVEHVGPNFDVTLDTGTTVRESGPESTAQETAALDPSDAGVWDLGGPTAATMSSHTTYGLDQIDAPEVWSEYGTKGGGATVAVLDTGVDPDHPDIDLSQWGDWDQYGNWRNTDPKDYGSHGTHVSGTVSGGDASGTHIGVAPDVELYHGAVLTDCSSGSCRGTGAQIAAGMQWAVENNVDVISMSLGSGRYSSGYIDLVRDARSAGTLVVASIGNDGVGTSGSPGNVYDTLSVGASDSNRNIADFSSGEQIDTSSAWGSSAPSDWPSQYTVPTVSAPGSQVKSSLPDGEYGYYQGTSMAAPHVSGAAALLQAATSADLSPSEIEAALVETATNPNGDGQDNRYGHGIVDVKAATDRETVVIQDHKICTDVDTDDATCPMGVITDTVQPTDERVYSWIQFQDVDSSFGITWKYYDPSGDLYTTIDTTANQDGSSYSWYAHWSWIAVDGNDPADMLGNWTVAAYVKGELEITDTFKIETEDTSPSIEDYTNKNDVVDTSGLRDAIDDWRTNEIGTDLLRDVISAWRSGEPVT